MNQHYTQKALNDLDAQILNAERQLGEAMLSMGSGAEADNNTWHDNPAFDQAKSDVDQAQTQLKRLRELRRDAIVVEVSQSDTIEVGSTVRIQFSSDDEPMLVHIGGHFVVRNASDENEAMNVSTESPLGEALLHRRSGETVIYSSPSGARMEVSILELV